MKSLLIKRLALRYLKGKRTSNAAPILSRISMVSIAVCSGAMIILFSVFNGFEALVKESYKVFYPDLKITKIRGKFFELPGNNLAEIGRTKGVHLVSQVIEDNVLAREDNMGGDKQGNDNQIVVTLRGVDKNYFKVNDLHEYMRRGTDAVSDSPTSTCIAGQTVANELGVETTNVFSYIMMYYLDPKVTNVEIAPESAFLTLRLHPSGTFSVLEEFDSKYIIAPITLAQKLFHAENQLSSIEISTDKQDIEGTKKRVQLVLGNDYVVASRFEQNKTMFMVMQFEKVGIFFILLLVLIIASFNMVGALSMLVLEKQKDIAILNAMGARPADVQKIFLAEGILWSLTGGGAGLALGLIICYLQQEFRFIKMGGSFLVEAYPVKVQYGDILVVLLTISVVGFITALYPSIRAKRITEVSLKSN